MVDPGIQLVAEHWIRRLEDDALHAHQALSHVECLQLAAVLRALLAAGPGPSQDSKGISGDQNGYPGSSSA